LVQAAIEQEGRTLCGECIVKTTNKDVVKAKKIAAELKAADYEAQKTALIKQQSKRAVTVLIICVSVFFAVQWFMTNNKPQPVKTLEINFTKNIYAAKALITIGLTKYATDNERLPEKLQQLYPKYLPNGVDNAFNQLDYQKIDDNSYSLEIIVPTNSETQSGATDEPKTTE